MRRAGAAWAGLAVGLILGCAPAPEEISLASHPPDPHVLYAGCATVLEGPVCVLPASRRLRLWIEDVGVEHQVVAGEVRRSSATGFGVASGRRLEIEIPHSVRTVTVERPSTEDPVWILELAPPEDRPWVDRFRQLASQGDLEAARALARDHTESADPVDQAVAHTWLRRLSYREGELEAFAFHARHAARGHAATGRLQDDVDESTAWIFHLLEEGRFAEAQFALDNTAPWPGESAEMTVRRAYFRGLWAEQVGDARTALQALSEAALTAERVRLEGDRRAALQVLARELQRVGRIHEAAEVFKRLGDQPSENPCERAQLAVNEGWTWWQIREAGGKAPDPIPRYQEALAEFGDPESACPRADSEVRNLELNLALAHLSAGRPAATRRALDRTDGSEGTEGLTLELWRLDLEGRLALAEGRSADALDRYRELGDLADSAALPDARWRAAVGRARALALRGDRSAAVAELTSAELLLDRETLRVPLGAGRGTFAGQREVASRWLVELLLEEGQPRKGLDAARRNRSRVLRGLRVQDRVAALDPRGRYRWSGLMERHERLRSELDTAARDWTLPASELERARRKRAELRRELTRTLDEAFQLLGDEPSLDLPELHPAELTLLAHPGVDGWVVFAARGKRVAVHRVPELEPLVDRPERLAAVLLQPFSGSLQEVERVRVLPYGALRGVDVHALPWRQPGSVREDGILLDALPVVYGLDLRRDSVDRTKLPALGGPYRILVVADPEGNLPQARREVELVTAAFSGGEVVRLEGEAATAKAVRRELPTVDVFHYAGHGSFRGLGGWESALSLSAGDRLTVGDVLALPRMPAWVVLSGCDTARTAEQSPSESLGLAQAFAAAGSWGVVAATRPVSDETAADLVTALYRAWDGRSPPAAALRTAQLELLWRHPESDWEAFRLITP